MEVPASQEEYMLSAVMALAITSLLSTLQPTNAQDYVLACFFLISTTSFLKIRWFMGTGMQACPPPAVPPDAMKWCPIQTQFTLDWSTGLRPSFYEACPCSPLFAAPWYSRCWVAGRFATRFSEQLSVGDGVLLQGRYEQWARGRTSRLSMLWYWCKRTVHGLLLPG